MKLTNLSAQLLAVLAMSTPFMANAVVETNTDFGRLSLGGMQRSTSTPPIPPVATYSAKPARPAAIAGMRMVACC